MAAPAPGATTNVAGANGTSVTVTKPTGAVEGDVVVICIYKENTAAISVGSTGFTVKTSYQVTTGGTQLVTVLWKRMGASEPTSWAFTWTGSTWRQVGAIRISGGKASGDPFDSFRTAVSDTTTYSFTTPIPEDFQPSVDETLLLAIGTNWEGATWTAPTGFTERLDIQTISFATVEQVSSAVVTGVSFTCNTGAASRTGAVFALAPISVGVDIPITVTDNTGSTDSIGSVDYVIGVNDNAGLVDTLIVPSAPNLENDTGLVDTIAVAIAVVNALTDTTGLTDANITQGWAAEGNDSVGLTDSVIFLNEPPIIAETDDVGLRDDGVSYGYVVTGREFVSLSDTLAIDRHVFVTDSAGVTEALQIDAVNLQTVNSTVGITDSGESKGLGAVGVNSVGLTDSISFTLTTSLVATVDDSMELSDVVQLQGLIPYVITDSTGLTDATQKYDVEEIINEVAGVQEGVFPSASAYITLADLIEITDDNSATGSRNLTISDTVDITDTTSNLGVATANVIDTTGLTDTVSTQLALVNVTAVDSSTGLTDSVSVTLTTGQVSSVNDNLGLTDDYVFSYSMVVSDTAIMSDVLELALSRIVNDTLGLTDSVSTSIATGTQVSVTDSVGLVDIGSVVLLAHTGAPDDVGLADSLIFSFDFTVTDTTGLTDYLDAYISGTFTTTRTDGAGLTDSVQTSVDWSRSITDLNDLSDQSEVLGVPVIVDRAGMTDTLTAVLTLPREITDSVGLVDRVRFNGILPTTFYYTYGALDLTVTTASDQLKITSVQGGPTVTIV